MLELKIKPEAQRDLIKIFEYTAANFGILKAEKYQDELYEGMELVINQEGIGKDYSHAERSYRKLHINRHLIFYRVEKNYCIVIRILHERMDIESQVGKGE